MSYKINQTDGTLLVDLVDGRIDEDTTDIVLVGRNYTGYGEYLNENLIRMLENFANSSAPFITELCLDQLILLWLVQHNRLC
jgi:hypothetical protein